MVMQRGVSLNELEQGPRTSGFDTTRQAFSKKTNKTQPVVFDRGIIAFVVIAGMLVYVYLPDKKILVHVGSHPGRPPKRLRLLSSASGPRPSPRK